MTQFWSNYDPAMIVSASYRSDIPAYYGAWFLGRLAAGYVSVRNPYGGRPARVGLTPETVSGFVLWTRNPAPFQAGFAAVAAMNRPFVVQMTITGYPRALEPGVLDVAAAIAGFRDLANRFGPRAVVWRYDPVILTEATPPDWHVATVARLADALAGATDECVFSFAHIYQKTRRNMTAAGLDWVDPPLDEKRDLLARLVGLVGERGMAASICAQPEIEIDSAPPARCIDAQRLADLAGRPIVAAAKGNRPGCLCAESRDIGRYDGCPQGCVYCYANVSRAAARRNLAAHDPAADAL